MDCFCVGEPWPGQLVIKALATPDQHRRNSEQASEKSLGMRAAFVDKYPNAAKAILMAVMEAQQWADKTRTRSELAAIMAKRQWITARSRHSRPRQRQVRLRTGRVVENSPHIMKY